MSPSTALVLAAGMQMAAEEPGVFFLNGRRYVPPYAGPPRCPRCRKHDTEPLDDGTGRYRCRRHADRNLFTPP